MVEHRANSRGYKSIAGVALVGLGTVILYMNLSAAFAPLANFVCANRCNELAALPAFLLAVWRVWQDYAANHQRFLENAVWQVLAFSWPILLVIMGIVLSRSGFRGDFRGNFRGNFEDALEIYRQNN